jgi:O-antigen ligase
VYIDLDYNFLKKKIFNFSLLLSSILILHFFISGDGLELFKWNQIAIDYYPGWSNTIPLYLIFSLYINRNKKRSQFYNYILILAIFITGSRGALLGGISIFLLPLIKRLSKYYFLLISSIIIILCLLIFIVINFENELPFFRAFDRIDIFLTSISYIEKSFLFGYGGNTIEQLSYVQISHEPIKDWGHTHNFLLEFALRYGIIGLILFILFIYNKIKEIKDFDSKYFFIIFIILAIFQTFMRDFTFLSILIIISNSLHLKQYTPLYSKNQH